MDKSKNFFFFQKQLRDVKDKNDILQIAKISRVDSIWTRRYMGSKSQIG